MKCLSSIAQGPVHPQHGTCMSSLSSLFFPLPQNHISFGAPNTESRIPDSASPLPVPNISPLGAKEAWDLPLGLGLEMGDPGGGAINSLADAIILFVVGMDDTQTLYGGGDVREPR